MAQIMEFLLNLLLLRGKFLTAVAAETVHEAIKKCLRFRRKLSMEYDKTTQIIGPFENMLELINYNASHYTCEGNYVVTSEVRYRLYEQFSKMKEKDFKKLEERELIKNREKVIQTGQMLDSVNKKLVENQNTQEKMPELPRPEKEKKGKDQDYLMDNLHAILKSQEFLFKNIIKLINFLEKDPSLQISSKKLDRIKYKLAACTDVLSSTVTSSSRFSDIINNIIEDEITRCRFRNGESKTSAEINLKTPKPKGLEAALDTSKKTNIPKLKKQQEKNLKLKRDINKKLKHKDTKLYENLNQKKNVLLRRQVLDSEVKRNSLYLLKQVKSEPAISSSSHIREKTFERHQKILRRTEPEIEDSKKLIKVNEEHFNQFENALWHSLTTLKYTELKEEYKNTCKCAFYNKRHFMAVDAALEKQVQEEDLKKIQKVVTISDSVFQVMERKLLFEDVKNQMKESIAIPKNKDMEAKISQHLVEEKKFYQVKQRIEENIKSTKIQQATDETRLQKLVAKNTGTTQIQTLNFKDTKSTTGATNQENAISEEIKKVEKKTEQNTPLQTNKEKRSNKELSEEKQKSKEPNQLKLLPSLQDKIVIPKVITQKPKTHNDQETNTIISSNSVQKCLDKISKNLSSKEETNSVTEEQAKDDNTKILLQSNKNSKLIIAEPNQKTNVKNEDTKLMKKKASVQQKNDMNKSKTESKKEPRKNEEGKSNQNLLTTDQKNISSKEETISITEEQAKNDTTKILLQNNKNNKLIIAEPNQKLNVKNEDTKTMKKKASVQPKNDMNKSVTETKNEPRKNEEGKTNQNVLIDQKIPKTSDGRQQTALTMENIKQTLIITFSNQEDTPKRKEEIPLIDASLKEVNPNILEHIEKVNRELTKSKTEHLMEKPTDGATEKQESLATTVPAAVSVKTQNKKRKEIISGQKLFEKVKSTPVLRTTKSQNISPHDLVIKPKERKGSSEPILSKETTEPNRITEEKFDEEDTAAEANLKSDNLSKVEEIDTEKKEQKLQTTETKSLSLQAIPKADGKLPITPPKIKQPRTLSVLELKSEADLIRVNKRAFDELEKTLHSVRFLVNNPVIMRTKSSPTQGKNFGEGSKKPFSTQLLRTKKQRKETMSKVENSEALVKKNEEPEMKGNSTYPECKRRSIRPVPPTLKSKTFSKSSSHRIETKKSVHAIQSVEVNGADKFPLNMRRTTKSAMKKQQVLTIFSKIPAENEEKKKPKAHATEDGEKKEAKVVDKSTKKTNYLRQVKRIPPLKNISDDFSKGKLTNKRHITN